MGACLMLTCAVIDDEKTPDWEAAELHIENMTVDEFDDSPVLLDQFDPDLVSYHEDAENDDETSEKLNVEPLRDRLRADVREFREALDGERTDIDYLLVRGAKVWVTGGVSWGDQPSELSSPMHRLHLAGVLAAAGFDGGQEGTAAGENAGCDRCGTNDRAEDSRYCQACVDAAVGRSNDGEQASARRATPRISPVQLGDVRDGHLVELKTDAGEGVQLAVGDLTEVQIEALASGRPVDVGLAADGEPVAARIIPSLRAMSEADSLALLPLQR